MSEMYQPIYTSEQITDLTEHQLLSFTPQQLDVINNWIEFYMLKHNSTTPLH